MENFVDIIRGICQSELQRQCLPEMLTGEVLDATNLRIRVDGRFEVEKDQLILAPSCKAQTRTTTGGYDVTIWRGLKEGDKVRMLRYGGGQLYYVLDREGED